MIVFNCSQCGKKLKAKPEFVGKKCRCTKCQQLNVIPGTALAGVTPPPSEPPVREPLRIPNEEESLLTPCNACKRMIAKLAATCPGCGAPNVWAHPEIVRFLYALYELSAFSHLPPFRVTWDKYILGGIDVRSEQAAHDAQSAASKFILWTPLSLTGLAMQAGFHYGAKALTQNASANVKMFKISFSTSPPVWETTDDRHWSSVLSFFRLRS